MILLPILVVCGLVIAHDQIPSVSLRKDPNTKLVIWGTRHGNRNPENFHMGNASIWGYEGPVELTTFGKRQSLGLGRQLRQFVGHWVNTNYLPKEGKYYSSSANRCQMTLQTVLAGFYEPQGWADFDTRYFDHWSPVPYTIDDPLLRMYAVDNCPKSDEAWKPISEDTLTELQELKEKHQDLLDYIAENTGWPSSISSTADMADNLIEIDLYRAHYPKWIENPTLAGYTKQSIIKEIMKFAENHQIKCAEHTPCREMMAGHWLHHITDLLQNARKGEGPKVVGYASHTEVTLALMKLMGVEKDELTTSAGFVLEYRDEPENAVRILNHDPTPIDTHAIYKSKYVFILSRWSSTDGWIPLDKFLDFVGEYAIKDWESACGRKKCE